MCDASHNGLGAVLEQLGPEVWRPISFSSRYLNEAEKKYSKNELEMFTIVWGAEYFRNYILAKFFIAVTDHKALISLLNGNNKKNKTIFSRLTRWLDRFIPFAFQLEHKPGAKVGRADYLSRHPIKEATPISTYDNIFTVVKINLIRTALGFGKSIASRRSNTCNNISKGQHIKAKSEQSINRLKFSSRDQPVEGGKSCERESTNQNRTHGFNQQLRFLRGNLVGAITQSKESCFKLSNSKIHNSKTQIKKWQKFLKQHPSLDSSSDEREELSPSLNLEAITNKTKSVKTNTTLSLPSAFKGETIPPVDLNSV